MSDEERLDRLLVSLPRERAGADFPARVLDRLDAPPPPARSRPRLRLVVAVAVIVLAVALPAGWLYHRHQERAALRAEVVELRAEHRRIEARLDELRRREQVAVPAIHLGGDDRVDYLFNPQRRWRLHQTARPGPGGAQRPRLPVRLTGGSL